MLPQEIKRRSVNCNQPHAGASSVGGWKMKQAFFASVVLLAMSVSPIYMLNGCTSDKRDKRDGFVLEMVGYKETIGANVFVNDKIVGSMTKRTEDVSSF